MDSEVTSGSQKGKITGTSSSKTTRRSWTWKEEDVLIHALKDIVTKGWKVDNATFRSGYLQVLERKLIIALPRTDLRATPHIESKIKKWKKAMRDTELKNLRNKQLSFYDDWCIIFGKDRAIGEFAEGPTDAVENLEKEADNNNGMPQQSGGGVGVEIDFSMSVTNPSSSNSEKGKKKRPRAIDAIMQGLTILLIGWVHILRGAVQVPEELTYSAACPKRTNSVTLSGCWLRMVVYLLVFVVTRISNGRPYK
ncbi:hypothetical protein Acr_00g0007560 [Actinidia rufa]|uniref:Myb/SANT-like DNA-binding domain protein n=1 Tax=Actinidia rufa TaxID=165716 RepID=A0A7J0D8D6_9ERIC|nr:hypothetical protein Acr_00g0007560 [Actinidia rufa]